jgi:peptidoglycan/LPS O-acetylase OafA/YrhL
MFKRSSRRGVDLRADQGTPACADGRVGTKDVHVDASHLVEGGSEKRVAELDSLRGLAALAVVVYHLRSTLLPWGWAAVDLFFVLSGYLITAIILKHGSSRGFFLRFYMRRGLRVWPIYFLTVGLIMACAPVLYSRCDWRGLPYVLTFTQNISYYWSNQSPLFSPYLGHTWTLAIEEQFYLLWPALVLLAGRKRLIPLALACLAGSILVRSRGMNVCLLAARGDGLALGGMLAGVLSIYRPGGPHRGRLLAFFGLTAGLSLLPLISTGAFTHPNVWALLANRLVVPILAFNTFWFGVVGLIVCQSGRPILAVLRLRPLRDLGKISYGLYLYHFPLYVMTQEAAAFTLNTFKIPLWLDALRLLACINAAWFSWVCIERPILRLKDWFSYGPAPALPSPSSRRHARSDGVTVGE